MRYRRMSLLCVVGNVEAYRGLAEPGTKREDEGHYNTSSSAVPARGTRGSCLVNMSAAAVRRARHTASVQSAPGTPNGLMIAHPINVPARIVRALPMSPHWYRF